MEAKSLEGSGSVGDVGDGEKINGLLSLGRSGASN